MENKKLDRLFREKAESYELQPTADAWASISGQTKKTSNTVILWKVAAAIAVLLSVTIVVWRQSNPVQMQVVVADHPVMSSEENELQVLEPTSLLAAAEAKTAEAPQATVAKEQEVQQAAVAQHVATETQATTESPVEIPVITVDERRALLAEERPTVPEIMSLPSVATEQSASVTEESPSPAVTIRYYADNSVEEDNVMDKKGFSTFLAKAQGFRPGEFLADLRTAKDDLLRSKKLN